MSAAESTYVSTLGKGDSLHQQGKKTCLKLSYLLALRLAAV